MNREIKFRAWDIESERMIYSDNLDDDAFFLIDENGIHCGCIGEETDDTGCTYGVSSDLDCEIMQFTGLKDKNGKEIYEGDIYFDERHGNRVIKYSEFQACFVTLLLKDERLGNPVHFENRIGIEVIGNIYENPELLEK